LNLIWVRRCWINTPTLREMQLMDLEQISIAPLNVEQVFHIMERHERFRERTSSASWVTEEEKRKEREAREHLVRDGAWTHNS